jgi:hypothetical protein
MQKKKFNFEKTQNDRLFTQNKTWSASHDFDYQAPLKLPWATTSSSSGPFRRLTQMGY